MEPLELRTHTRLWQVEKKLYKLYDYTLPMPVSLRMLGIFILVTVPWAIVMITLKIPFRPPFGYLVWIGPPVALTWAGNRPVAEGKRLGELLVSQVSFYTRQHRTYVRLAPHYTPETIHLRAEVWRPYDTDIPYSENPPGSEFKMR